MKEVKHYLSLIILCIYILFIKLRKVFLILLLSVFFCLLIYYLLTGIWRFQCIPGYEWDFSITLYEFLLGISAFISALAIISSGFIWLFKRLDKNETIINSCQPYIRIGESNIFHIKSQHEFSQIIREAPLEILQTSSVFFIISFSSKNNNENKILYKSVCKQRFGIFWILKIERDRIDDTLLTRINRAKSFLFGSKQYEDYIIKNKENTNGNEHKLDCEIILDPMFFLAYNKNISISIRIQNSDRSQTPWYKFTLNIEDNAFKEIYKKLHDNIADKDSNKWLEKWCENLKKNNESKFDFNDRI
jgi:hypothetical protein